MANLIPNLSETELECGVDEAGCGPAFGPVVAAAVVMPAGWWDGTLDDSKKLSEKKRVALYDRITREAVAWSVGQVCAADIDRINILQARMLAMRLAVESLGVRPTHLVVDGDRFHGACGIPHTCVVKGDSKVLSIAAASVVAKVTRDRLIEQMSGDYWLWGLSRNKGYLTREHIELINKNGLSDQHRRSFCKKFI